MPPIVISLITMESESSDFMSRSTTILARSKMPSVWKPSGLPTCRFSRNTLPRRGASRTVSTLVGTPSSFGATLFTLHLMRLPSHSSTTTASTTMMPITHSKAFSPLFIPFFSLPPDSFLLIIFSWIVYLLAIPAVCLAILPCPSPPRNLHFRPPVPWGASELFATALKSNSGIDANALQAW